MHNVTRRIGMHRTTWGRLDGRRAPASVAQWSEHSSRKRKVRGSSPRDVTPNHAVPFFYRVALHLFIKLRACTRNNIFLYYVPIVVLKSSRFLPASILLSPYCPAFQPPTHYTPHNLFHYLLITIVYSCKRFSYDSAARRLPLPPLLPSKNNVKIPIETKILYVYFRHLLRLRSNRFPTAFLSYWP